MKLIGIIMVTAGLLLFIFRNEIIYYRLDKYFDGKQVEENEREKWHDDMTARITRYAIWLIIFGLLFSFI